MENRSLTQNRIFDNMYYIYNYIYGLYIMGHLWLLILLFIITNNVYSVLCERISLQIAVEGRSGMNGR